LEVYHGSQVAGPYRYEPLLAGRRSLRNLCLAYLLTLEDQASLALCLAQYQNADNMTDCMGALGPLAHGSLAAKEEMLDDFYGRWHDDPLVLDKWFSLQATAPLPDTLERVQRLMAHPAFTIKNPNRVRALLGAFAAGNPVCFHAANGAGYAFLAEQVLVLDPINSQIAARLLGNFARWHRFDAGRQGLMRAQLERVLARPGLSRDVFEVASKSLA
jgi:aminopeptidase N